jgi:hypothetical protein
VALGSVLWSLLVPHLQWTVGNVDKVQGAKISSEMWQEILLAQCTFMNVTVLLISSHKMRISYLWQPKIFWGRRQELHWTVPKLINFSKQKNVTRQGMAVKKRAVGTRNILRNRKFISK